MEDDGEGLKLKNNGHVESEIKESFEGEIGELEGNKILLSSFYREGFYYFINLIKYEDISVYRICIINHY